MGALDLIKAKTAVRVSLKAGYDVCKKERAVPDLNERGQSQGKIGKKEGNT